VLPIDKVFTKRVHVFKAGPQVSAQGVEREFSPKDLDEVVQSYDPGTHEAPVVIGHSGDNDSAPSYGWIKKFVRQGNDLYADVDFTDVAKDLVKRGHYGKVSISFYSPSSPINPHKGKWSARHLALLGASPPAVKGLEPFSFSERDGVFDYATPLTPGNIFDTDLGPTMIEEKSPLEVLKERLDEIRGELSDSLKSLEENQNKQSQVDVGQEETEQPAEMTTSQFSELKKKVSEASQKLANLETMAPSDSYDEGIKRVSAKGAHGHNVQVVEEVFEEKSNEKTKKTNPEKILEIAEEIEDSFGEDGVTRKVSKGAHGQEVQVVEQVYDEGVDRRISKGAHGQEVQVVEQVHKEKAGKKKGTEPVIVEEDLEEEYKEKGKVPAGMSLEGEEAVEEQVKGKKKTKAPAMMDGEDGDDMESGDEEFKERRKEAKAPVMDDEDMEDGGDDEAAEGEYREMKKKVAKKPLPLMDEEDDEAAEGEYAEGVGDKSAKGGKVSFGKHSEKKEDVAGRGSTGRSEDDSYGDRQSVGKGKADGREMISDDGGDQDAKRAKTAQDGSQDASRMKMAKASPSENTDAESRWAEQSTGKDRATNANQYDAGTKGLPDRSKPGTSDGDEPHGRDGGPTKVSKMMEEDPSDEDIAVPLQSTKGNKTVRVLHQQSGDKRASLKGGDIPDLATEVDHAEGVGHKTTSNGKVSFGKHSERRPEDPTGRGVTGASEDPYKHLDDAAKASEEDREGVIADGGRQDRDRTNTARHTEQDADRVRTAKASADDRWEDQPKGAEKAMNNDQFDDSHDAGISDGNEPHGRDGGPTKVSTLMEEDPSDEEFATPLKNVKQSDNVRVVYQKTGEKRAPVKGGAIDHAEGEADGLTREPAPAKVSGKKNPMGRSDGPTEFPDKSEEDPDNMEMAVDLEDATQSKKVRIVRQKSGDAPTLDHKEKAKTPMTKTGKGSTYGQKSPVLVEEEEIEEGYKETEEYCGMGSLGQAKAMGYPAAMFEELKALKAENDRLKKEYEETKIRARKAKIAEFVENLYIQGKLTDGIIPQGQLQNYCEGLEFGTLEFAEGESTTTTLFTLLDRLPNLVYFSEVVSNAPFQDPEDDDLDPHEKAMKMVANGEASDYVEAIKRCIPWGGNG
jgi:hypothetical protein